MFFICLLLVLAQTVFTQNYIVDAQIEKNKLPSAHLKMGGENFLDETIDVNNSYLSIDGKPVIPITGEFHFSRFPNQLWNESIHKMKAGELILWLPMFFRICTRRQKDSLIGMAIIMFASLLSYAQRII